MQKLKLKRNGNLIFTIVVVLAMVVTILVKESNRPDQAQAAIGYGTDVVKAEVVQILESGTVQLGAVEQEYQIAQVRVLEGAYQGQLVSVDHGTYQILPKGFRLSAGEQILVTVGNSPGGELRAYFIDYIRLTPILVLFAMFVIMSILVSGWKGFQSLLSMGISLLIIFYFIIPQILEGADPIWTSILGSFLFLAVTQYLVYGWTLKTHVALVAITITMTITGFLSVWFVNLTYLNGFGNENAMFLMQQGENLNIQNVLIASIIIGTLGVLDDLVISQASVVMELHTANPDMNFRQRYKAAFHIGRDHIAATVNTLVLAYVGAGLMMFLLFSLNNPDYLLLLNINSIAEEIVRSLVGTLGLFSAVPITNLIACWAVDSPERIHKLCRIFGPLGSSHQD
ncbi:MAG: YibE/F family protein [Anaerolineae bacterium]|nr:YibE/F family protein [Anaerolineae bacterium]